MSVEGDGDGRGVLIQTDSREREGGGRRWASLGSRAGAPAGGGQGEQLLLYHSETLYEQG